jgi:serpin B
MDRVLGAGDDPDFDRALRALSDALEAAASTAELDIANTLWCQEAFPLDPGFEAVLAGLYDGVVGRVDFVGSPEAAAEAINVWVAERTKDRIRQMVDAEMFSELTRLVLANAVYLRAKWEVPFDQTLTADAAFRLLDGDEVEVATMRRTGPYPYARVDDVEVVGLPYQGGGLSLVAVVPPPDRFLELERCLDVATVERLLGSLQITDLALTLPRFEFRTRAELTGVLKTMGMPTAFSTAADFGGISTAEPLLISDVFHEAFVTVDEEGTEAAAATVVVVAARAAPIRVVEMRIDRPFLVMVSHTATGAPLFLGRVTDPRSGPA